MQQPENTVVGYIHALGEGNTPSNRVGRVEANEPKGTLQLVIEELDQKWKAILDEINKAIDEGKGFVGADEGCHYMTLPPGSEALSVLRNTLGARSNGRLSLVLSKEPMAA